MQSKTALIAFLLCFGVIGVSPANAASGSAEFGAGCAKGKTDAEDDTKLARWFWSGAGLGCLGSGLGCLLATGQGAWDEPGVAWSPDHTAEWNIGYRECYQKTATRRQARAALAGGAVGSLLAAGVFTAAML